MTGPTVIAIDGAAGSGKSTLARGLARAVGLPYVNTGLMYRALTLEALDRGLDPDVEAPLVALMRTLRFSLSDAGPPELRIEGSPPSPDLSAARVEAAVSRVAGHPEVRTLMRDAQRVLGERGAVMEGRDIASVVFPEAAVKIYLIADPGVRQVRRAAERTAEPASPPLRSRDATDASVNRFEPQPGATVIDTTNLDIEGTLAAALALVRATLSRGRA